MPAPLLRLRQGGVDDDERNLGGSGLEDHPDGLGPSGVCVRHLSLLHAVAGRCRRPVCVRRRSRPGADRLGVHVAADPHRRRRPDPAAGRPGRGGTVGAGHRDHLSQRCAGAGATHHAPHLRRQLRRHLHHEGGRQRRPRQRRGCARGRRRGGPHPRADGGATCGVVLARRLAPSPRVAGGDGAGAAHGVVAATPQTA